MVFDTYFCMNLLKHRHYFVSCKTPFERTSLKKIKKIKEKLWAFLLIFITSNQFEDNTLCDKKFK